MEEVRTSKLFQINRAVLLDRTLFKKDFRRYYPPSIATINNTNTTLTIDIPREDSYIDLHDSYLKLEIQVVKNADDTLYADGNGICLVNLGPVALFSEATLSNSSQKKLEHVEQVYQATLMHKMLSSGEGELMTYFEKDTQDAAVVNTERRNRLLNNTPEKGTLFVRIPLKDIFGYVYHQDKITYGLGYILKLRTADHANAIFRTIADVAKLTINDISLYVSHYTPSVENQTLVTNVVLNKEPITMGYVERKVFTKQVNTNSSWNFELGVEAGMQLPIYVIVGFQSADRLGPAQTQNNGVFDQLPIIEAYCKIGSVKYPDESINLDYLRNDYDDGYNEVLKFFREYVGEQTVTPYITFQDFKEKYNLYLFDLRNQRDHIASQQVTATFKFVAGDDVVAENYTAFALVLTNRVINITSDGSRQFDIDVM